MKKIELHWQILIGLVVGLIYAFLAVKFDWNQFTLDYIKPIGDIFINILKLIAVPLVLFSVISGIVSLTDIKQLGRVGVKTLALYLLTTVLAVTIGLLVVNIAKPGERVSEAMKKENRVSYELWRNNNNVQKMDDICLSCDPSNAELVKTVQKKQGDYKDNDWVKDKLEKAKAQKQTGPLQPLIDVVPKNIFQALSDMSMLQIIFFAIFFGIILSSLPQEKGQPVIKLVDGLNEVFTKMVWAVMKAMPIFVFALMAGQIVKAAGTDPEKFNDLLVFLSKYSLTVIFGLLLMIIIYPIVVRIFTKIKPLFFIKSIKDAQITALTTSSSVATLPVTLDCIQNNLKVSKSVSNFVLPIGATVNMDGTSLYQAVAVVALAQFHMVDLSIAQQLVIVITATLASIGAAAIPSAGLVLMIIVLESVGLNPAWIALIFPVDRILDMCRTVVNVTGDATVSTIIAKSENELNLNLETGMKSEV
jgi:Na+/H+-dicarboxylate symporter